MSLTPEDNDDTSDDLPGDEAAQSIEDLIAERPLTAVAIAVLFGFVVARLVF
jgi:ElaB/YqjD/DUF883 family membrane-anchored ribosome-binding protein